MTIDLYTVSCDPHTVDKTDYITATAAVSGTVRGELDIQQPIVEITGDISGYNYAKIDGRYYFIENCNRLRTGLSVVRMSVDVLWTYAAQIMQLPAVASRSYRLVNAYLPDDQQRVRQYTQCHNHNIGDALDYVVSGPGYCHIVVTVG